MNAALLGGPAFLLRRADYGERHVIVDLLGKEVGRFSAIAYNAKGSSKRFAGGLQPLRVLEATVSSLRSGDLYRLDSLEVVEDFPGLELRLETLTAGSYATELLREVAREGEAGRPLFGLLRSFLLHLPEAPTTAAVLRLVYQFEFQVLEYLGEAPAVCCCARCLKPTVDFQPYRCSRRGEGLICDDCRQPADHLGRIPESTLQMLQHLASPEEVDIPLANTEEALHQAGRVIATSIDLAIEKPLLARDMLRSLY